MLQLLYLYMSLDCIATIYQVIISTDDYIHILQGDLFTIKKSLMLRTVLICMYNTYLHNIRICTYVQACTITNK